MTRQNIQDEWTNQLSALIYGNWINVGFSPREYPDGSISFSIQKKETEFWVTSMNSEYSVGFTDSTGSCTWHTHMSLFGANSIEEQLLELRKKIDGILLNKVFIAYSTKRGYWLPDDSEDNEKKDKASNDISILRCWIDIE